MKIITAVFLALACLLGLTVADYGYGAGSYGYGGGASYVPVFPGGQSGGLGNGGFLYLIGLIFLIMILFGSNTTTTSTSPSTTVIGG